MSLNLTEKFAKFAAPVALVAGLSACASPTYLKTAGMERSPAVADPSLKTTVAVDPCLRANIDARYIGDVTPQDIAEAKIRGENVRYHRAFYMTWAPSAMEGWQTAAGAIVGGLLGNAAGKAIGLHGAGRTAGTIGGAIGGGAAGAALSKEANVGNLVEIKACEQYLDKVMYENGIQDRPQYNIPTYAPRGRYPTPNQIIQLPHRGHGFGR